jgi:hypothetical protein
MYVISFLIIFFTFLLIYQLLPSFSLKEGLENPPEYQPYDTANNPMILAQQNAGNIEVLKKRVDDLNGMKQSIDDLTQNVNKLNDEVGQISQQQADYAQNLVGSTPPSISGTSTDTTTTTPTTDYSTIPTTSDMSSMMPESLV